MPEVQYEFGVNITDTGGVSRLLQNKEESNIPEPATHIKAASSRDCIRTSAMAMHASERKCIARLSSTVQSHVHERIAVANRGCSPCSRAK